jgi:BASS family bile acid:Na+ symporter
MDLKQLVILSLQVSIIATLLGFGLNTRATDLLALLRRPGLLARALLSVFVIMPIVAIALVQWFEFPSTVEVVMIALAISPVPPLLPQREGKAGGSVSFGLGLMAMLALVAIIAVPTIVAVLERVYARSFVMPSSAIAGIVLKAVLAPLALGMIIRATLPALADRLGRVAEIASRMLLPVAVLVLLLGTATQIWQAAVPSAIVALTLFTVAGLAIGHVLGGPDPDHSVVLALSTACRHPAIALTIATANFPDQRFAGTILLYLIVNAIVAIPYVTWLRRQAALRPQSS